MNISIVFLTFFGLLPSNVGRPRNSWIYLGFIIIAVELFVAWQFDIFYGLVGILRAIQIVKFASPLVVHLVSLLEVRVFKGCELSFQIVDKDFPHWILLYVLTTEVLKLILDYSDVAAEIEYLSCLASTIFIKLRFLCHTHYTSIIHEKLKDIKNRLKSHNTQDFLITKTTYNLTTDMLCSLQEFYSWSLVCMFTHIFINITTDVYWIYVLCLNEKYLHILTSMFSIIDNLIVLYLPLLFCDWSLATAREISLIVGIYSSEKRWGFSNFAMQMMNNPFRFQVFGFLQMHLDFMKEVSFLRTLLTFIYCIVIVVVLSPTMGNYSQSFNIAIPF